MKEPARACSYRHPDVVAGAESGCLICRLFLGETVGNIRISIDKTRTYVVCKSRGDLVPLEVRHELGLGTLRHYYPCDKGYGKVPGFVCCSECNDKCEGYEAGNVREDTD